MLASVVTANSERMPITTMTTTVCTFATACEPDDVEDGHHHDDEDGEGLDQPALPSATAALA